MQRILNSYPTHRLHFGEVETPYRAKKYLHQTLDQFAVPLDLWAFPIELVANRNFAYAFILTFPKTQIFCFSKYIFHFRCF